jgi:hypothetical protein
MTAGTAGTVGDALIHNSPYTVLMGTFLQSVSPGVPGVPVRHPEHVARCAVALPRRARIPTLPMDGMTYG